MARSRNIKPGFFKNEILAEMPVEARLLFIGLWTLADREGRLEDRPKRIRAELFAFDGFDVDSMLNQLQSNGFLTRYEADQARFIQIENFVKHQDPHYKEKASEIPPPPGCANLVLATGVTRTQRARILERDGYTCQACQSKEHLCIDHVLPVSRGGDSADDNLQVLCLSCNTKKGNKVDGEVKNISKKGSFPIPAERGFVVESTSGQRRIDQSAVSPLIPSSLIPSSLIPDSLSLDSDAPAVASGADRAPPSRGSRLPADWVIPEEWHIWATSEFPQWPCDHVNTIAFDFADYWHAKAGKDAVKTDWFATWRRWCRKAHENVRAPPMSFRERDSALAAARVHEMTGGLVSAKTKRPDALQEVFDALPIRLAR